MKQPEDWKKWREPWDVGRTPKEFFISLIMYPSRGNKCVGESWTHFYERFGWFHILRCWLFRKGENGIAFTRRWKLISFLTGDK